MLFGFWAPMGPSNHVLDGVQIPHGNGQFSGGGECSCKALGHCVVICKKAEPIEMPIGLWARMGPRKHVSDGSPNPPMGRGNFGEGHPL